MVQTHRDPVKALPSLCSVLAQSRAIVEGDAIDRHEIGTRELDNWSHALEDCDRKRQIAPEQFIDIQQSDIHKNPMTVVRQIYAKAGLELTDSVEQAMAERIERNPEGSQGVHSYTVEEFGFSEADIRAAFRSYIDNHLGT